jgi:hypothetical protein
MKRTDLVLLAYGVLCVLLFVPRLLWPQAAFYQHVLTQQILVYISGLSKLAPLALGGLVGLRVTRGFARDNQARLAFLALTAWLLLWSVGQACLLVYQWRLGEALPFPSLADPFFVAGGLALLFGFARLVQVYVSSGLALGSRRSYVLLALSVGLVSLALGYLVLEPIWHAGGSPLELALNLIYPGLDLVALVPAALLFRITLLLRGGALFRVWSLFLSGFLALALGDVLYAYITMLDWPGLERLMDAGFIFGYSLVALGMYEQYRLTA